jgi:hypothetical protein
LDLVVGPPAAAFQSGGDYLEDRPFEVCRHLLAELGNADPVVPEDLTAIGGDVAVDHLQE